MKHGDNVVRFENARCLPRGHYEFGTAAARHNSILAAEHDAVEDL